MAPAPRIERWLLASAVIALAVGLVELAQLDLHAALVTSDFAVFRMGGELVLLGEDPYDRAMQEAAMREVLGAGREGGHLGFLLPPHAATLFAPFALLPLGVAFGLFSLLSALALARLVVALADLARAPWPPVAVVVVSLGPVLATFRLGQLAILTALLLAELARAVRDEDEIRMGIALGVLGLKPQFVPVVGAYLLGAGRFRALGVATLTTLALGLPIGLVFGPRLFVSWATGLGALEEAFAVATPPYMVNARAIAARVLGDPDHRATATAAAWALFASTAVVAVALGIRSRHRPFERLALVLSLALLSSPHLFFHDLVAWSVPIALAVGLAEGDRMRWTYLALAAPIALLAVSPIEPALGVLLPVPPQLLVPLVATAWSIRARPPRERIR